MRGLFPDDYFQFVLPIHRGLPANDQPVLYARYITPRERRIQQRIVREATAAAEAAIADATDEQIAGEEDLDEAAAVPKLVELWQLRLTGWSNVRIGGRSVPFTPENIAAFVLELDIAERWGVGRFCDQAIGLKREDLGKSESPSPSVAVVSAPAASSPAPATPTLRAPGGAAKTGQAPKPPKASSA